MGAIVVASAVIVAVALGVALVVGGDDPDDAPTAADGDGAADEGDDASPDPDADDPAADDPGADAPSGDDPGADAPGADDPGDGESGDDDVDPDGPGEAAQGGTDREVELPPIDPDDDLDQPDVGALGGSDAAFAEVLLDVDASERTMMRYQQGIVATLLDGGPDDPVDLLAELSAIANTAANELLTIRERLEADVDDAGASEVRDRYVEHLDTWVAFMRAVQERPALLGPDADTDRFTLAINVSADAFARSLEDRLPEDADVEVARFADDILERGFRSGQDAQV